MFMLVLEKAGQMGYLNLYCIITSHNRYNLFKTINSCVIVTFIEPNQTPWLSLIIILKVAYHYLSDVLNSNLHNRYKHSINTNIYFACICDEFIMILKNTEIY